MQDNKPVVTKKESKNHLIWTNYQSNICGGGDGEGAVEIGSNRREVQGRHG